MSIISVYARLSGKIYHKYCNMLCRDFKTGYPDVYIPVSNDNAVISLTSRCFSSDTADKRVLPMHKIPMRSLTQTHPLGIVLLVSWIHLVFSDTFFFNKGEIAINNSFKYLLKHFQPFLNKYRPDKRMVVVFH